MGEYGKGTNYAKGIDPSSSNILDPGTFGGKLRVMQDYFGISAGTTMVSTDYVTVGQKLPTGAQVVSVILGYPAAAGATGTSGFSSSFLVVGDQGDVNRYITQTQCSTAAVAIGPNNTTGVNYVVTGTTDNYIRVANYGDTDGDNLCIVSTGPIKITVLYVVE